MDIKNICQELENLLYSHENLIDQKYEPYTTNGEIWELEEKFKNKKEQFLKLLKEMTK